jgi:hypothetical protein
MIFFLIRIIYSFISAYLRKIFGKKENIEDEIITYGRCWLDMIDYVK